MPWEAVLNRRLNKRVENYRFKLVMLIASSYLDIRESLM